MRVVVTGATGNVGTSLLRCLVEDPKVTSIVGLARRRAGIEVAKTTWVSADVSRDDLAPHFEGADAIVHLAWLIQPSRDLETLRRTNIDGTARVFKAASESSVHTLVYASSVGAYSPGPKDRLVDETWPTGGIETSFYSRHKAEAERLLDDFERDNRATRVVRLRPGLIFKRAAGASVTRLFAGRLLPRSLVRRSLLPLIPYTERLRFQAVHSHDVGRAYHLALTRQVRGPFNIVAEPVLDAETMGEVFDAKPLRVPAGALRAVTAATWRLRLQPTPAGWVDLALQSPLLDASRARTVLGWAPTVTATEALRELLGGIRDGAGMDTPALHPRSRVPRGT